MGEGRKGRKQRPLGGLGGRQRRKAKRTTPPLEPQARFPRRLLWWWTVWWWWGWGGVEGACKHRRNVQGASGSRDSVRRTQGQFSDARKSGWAALAHSGGARFLPWQGHHHHGGPRKAAGVVVLVVWGGRGKAQARVAARDPETRGRERGGGSNHFIHRLLHEMCVSRALKLPSFPLHCPHTHSGRGLVACPAPAIQGPFVCCASEGSRAPPPQGHHDHASTHFPHPRPPTPHTCLHHPPTHRISTHTERLGNRSSKQSKPWERTCRRPSPPRKARTGNAAACALGSVPCKAGEGAWKTLIWPCPPSRGTRRPPCLGSLTATGAGMCG